MHMIVFTLFVSLLFFPHEIFCQGTWTNYTNAQNIRPNAVEKDYVWAGSYGGGVIRWNRNTGGYKKYTCAEGLVSNRVTGIAIDNKGNKWFSTAFGGVSKFDGTKWTAYTQKDGLGFDVVNTVAIDRDGSLWFGTSLGVSKFDG
ncbi:MAG: hypothetical protein M1426_04335, partial [Patescibacteria group bacterium]|nr:hypothetical protein [Patescibacteria group bacterium]